MKAACALLLLVGGLIGDDPLARPGRHPELPALQGAGGMYGGRGGHRNLRAGGGGDATEAAVDAGLAWLRRNQRPDGSWPAPDRAREAGVSAFALLAFLGAGETHWSGSHRRTVERGLRYLLRTRGPDGRFGATPWDHATAAIVFAEAHGLTGMPRCRAAAERAVRDIERMQTPYRGWSGDVTLTAWMLVALKAADATAIPVDPVAVESATRWLDRRTAPGTGLVGDPTVLPPTPTAAAVFARCLSHCGRWRHPLEVKAKERLLECVGRRGDDLFYWHFGTVAAFQARGEGARLWKAWNRALWRDLLPLQRTEGKDRGSWDPRGGSSATDGRALSTALAVLCLETYYRYAICFGSG